MKKIVLAIIFLASIFFFLYYYYDTSVNKSIENEGGAIFSIESGESIDQIATELVEKKLIKSALFFRLYAWLTENDSKLKAGDYKIKSAVSIKDIIDILVGGQSINREKSIKILEGWTITDIDAYLSQNKISTANEFAKLANHRVSDWLFTFPRPAWLENLPAETNLEGYLFPDTYRIFIDAKAEDIIFKMLNNFEQKVVLEFGLEAKKQKKSLRDLIIMASIIEKEAPNFHDASYISGILFKRLAIGMRLEVDSSINYLSGKSDPQASYEDLKIKSPYNTYQNYGLPPGPISNPGLESIKAAFFPKESKYLFYLNRQDTKETIFSQTYDEHLRNKRKYLP